MAACGLAVRLVRVGVLGGGRGGKVGVGYRGSVWVRGEAGARRGAGWRTWRQGARGLARQRVERQRVG